MKTCPECGRTYAEESFSFCLDDGALLSAPYDPDATLVLGSTPDKGFASTIVDHQTRGTNQRISTSREEPKRACRVVVVEKYGKILYSTPTRHSRPDLRSQIISFQRRWLQNKHPELKSRSDVNYKLQWLEGDEWVFD
jgi:hypothetical protein